VRAAPVRFTSMDVRVNACLALAILSQGKAITTIEGLVDRDRLHPVQAAFLEHDHATGVRLRDRPIRVEDVLV
jgi:aerobic-type carbon monoxide dehydrogenase small subunit (CoxS/CutS family)